MTRIQWQILRSNRSGVLITPFGVSFNFAVLEHVIRLYLDASSFAV